MNIQLDQKEIEAAIRSYIEEKGLDISDKTIDIKMTAGRKHNGYSAAVTIEPKSATVTSVNTAEVTPETESKDTNSTEIDPSEEKINKDAPLFG